MKTILHTFEFDVRTPEGRTAWDAFKAECASGPRCFGPVLSKVYHPFNKFDGQTVTLETKHLFDNQWNTTEGVRVFDFALQSDCAPHSELSAPRGIRRGHYLEQTAEMKEIRRNTNACGYCGHQESAAKGAVFCGKCLNSPYLKEGDLHLTRMIAVDAKRDRKKLSKAETAHLMPIYLAAQTKRQGAENAKIRADVIAKAEKKIALAAMERDGVIWLIDHDIPTDNVIFYSHTPVFCFGWRNDGVSESVRDALLDVISEFPFPYKIKVKGGRTLEHLS